MFWRDKTKIDFSCLTFDSSHFEKIPLNILTDVSWCSFRYLGNVCCYLVLLGLFHYLFT